MGAPAGRTAATTPYPRSRAPSAATVEATWSAATSASSRVVLVHQLGEDARRWRSRAAASASPSARRGSQRPSAMRSTPRRASLPLTWTSTSSSADTPSRALRELTADVLRRRRPRTHGTRGGPARPRATRPHSDHVPASDDRGSQGATMTAHPHANVANFRSPAPKNDPNGGRSVVLFRPRDRKIARGMQARRAPVVRQARKARA